MEGQIQKRGYKGFTVELIGDKYVVVDPQPQNGCRRCNEGHHGPFDNEHDAEVFIDTVGMDLPIIEPSCF